MPFAFADKLTFLGFLIAFLFAILLSFLVYKFDFLKYPIFGVSLYIIGDTVVTFLDFISKTILSKNQNFWIMLLFFFPLIYFCFRKVTEIFNFSLVCGIACGLLLIFFFLATLKDFNLENIYIYSFPRPKNLFHQAVPYIKGVTLSSAVLTLFAKQNKTPKTVMISGVCIGSAFLLISIFNSLLLFGPALSGELSYPYASAISTVTFGNLFWRLDGLCYFIYFVTAVIKIAVCVSVVKKEKANCT